MKVAFEKVWYLFLVLLLPAHGNKLLAEIG